MTETTIGHERGGRDGPLLVLIHGLGANAAVWDGLVPVLERNWPGRWLIPELRGHGRSVHRPPYGFGIHAADIAALLDQDKAVTLLGHSMGGMVSFALATGIFGIRVRHVVAFGVKVDWPAEDLARAESLAATPAKTFADREAAAERYLLVSGLKGLVGPESRTARHGVATTQDGFRLAADPRINAVGRPDAAALVRAAQAPIALFAGENDPIGHAEGMGSLGPEVTVLPGLGHNPHVENPEVFWQAIEHTL